MIITKMFKLFLSIFFLNFLFISQVYANQDFNEWLINFQKRAINSGVSEKVVKEIMSEAKFLPKVIE